MAANNVRLWLRDQLRAQLGTGWQLTPYDQELTPSRKTVMLFRSQVIPTPEAPRGSQTHTITLYVATAKQVGPDALDTLDAALDAVLVALHQIKNVRWTSAEYQVLSETIPVFKVQVEVPANIQSTES